MKTENQSLIRNFIKNNDSIRYNFAVEELSRLLQAGEITHNEICREIGAQVAKTSAEVDDSHLAARVTAELGGNPEDEICHAEEIIFGHTSA